MNSSEEVNDLVNFAKQSDACPLLFLAIAGSRLAEATGTFTFDQYIPSPTPGELVISSLKICFLNNNYKYENKVNNLEIGDSNS